MAASIAEPPVWTKRAAPKGIARVPTHAVRPVSERRGYARAKLRLPLQLKRVAGEERDSGRFLQTANISSSGVLFLCPDRIEPGTAVELEVRLVERPLGRGSVLMVTTGHVVRASAASKIGWHAVAASFDEISFEREEIVPARFET
jgi:hypothetical protein